MKYDEVMTGLKCLSGINIECKNCAYKGFNFPKCREEVAKCAIELVNEQNKEIEKLNKEVDRLSQCVMSHDGQVYDAIKNFAEMLKTEYSKPDLLLEQNIIVIEECMLNEIVKKWSDK